MLKFCCVFTLLWTLTLSVHSNVVIPDKAGFVNNWKMLLSEKSCEALEYHPSLAKTATACEENTVSLNCTDQEDTAIVVCAAMFGRDNLHECSPARSMDTQCYSLDAINIVTDQCQWKSQCTIKASKHEFADPCPKQSKFLRVKYHCLNKLYGSSLITTTTTTTMAPEPTGTTTEPLYCAPTKRRGVFWPRTIAGKNAFVDCPGPSEYYTLADVRAKKKRRREVPYARLKCGPDGRWRRRPDLSRCTSKLGYEMNKIVREIDTGKTPVLEAAKAVEKQIADSKLTYGGDIVSTVEAIHKTANMTVKQNVSAKPIIMDVETVNQVAKSLTRSGSDILSDEKFPIWADLPELKQDMVGTRLMVGIEQSMMAEAEAMLKVTNPILPPEIVGSGPGVAEVAEEGEEEATLHIEANIVAEVSVVNVNRLGRTRSKIFPEKLKQLKLKAIEESDIGGDSPEIFYDSAESVVMPTSELEKHSTNGLAKVVYIQYRNLERFMGFTGEFPTFNDSFSNRPVDENFAKDPNTVYVDYNGQDGQSHVLNSKIITISLGGHTRGVKMSLNDPVIFTLRHERKNDWQRPKCCFWDYNPWTYRGAWSAEGCYQVRTNSSHTTCGCNHLTSFAILIDISDQDRKAPDSDRNLLSLITTVGCTVSSICLLLFWFTFQFIDKKLDGDQRTVHKHLAACLFFGEVLFVTAIRNASEYQSLCKAVAMALQFLFTSAFIWMLLEGVQIAIKLNELVPSSTRKWPIYYLASYGSGILLVGLTAGISAMQAYGNNEICWLSGRWLFFFAIPVGVIVLINICILSYLIFKACQLLSFTNDHVVHGVGKESKLHQTRSTVKGIAAATVLLGLTWSFGFLYINQHFILAAYLFAIFNSLQGFWLFLFFCVFNKWIRRQFSAWFCNICCCNSLASYSNSNNKNKTSRTPLTSKEREAQLLPAVEIDESDYTTSSSLCCCSSSSSKSRKIGTANNRGDYYPVTPSAPSLATPSVSLVGSSEATSNLHQKSEIANCSPTTSSNKNSPHRKLVTVNESSDQTPGKSIQSDTSTLIVPQRNPTQEQSCHDSAKNKFLVPSADTETSTIHNRAYDSIVLSGNNVTTENLTDYMAQAFAMADSASGTAQELRDFDDKINPDVVVLAQEDEFNDQEDEDTVKPMKDDPVPLICNKSKTFSDFLSVLVKKHEDGLIDEEAAKAQNRMFLSKMLDNLAENQKMSDSTLRSNESSSSSLSISAIPDIHGPLDELHVSTGSLDKSGLVSPRLTNGVGRHDSGFCSNKPKESSKSPALNSSNIDKKFPIRQVDRARSESNIFDAGRSKKHHQGGMADDDHNLDASQMFDDTDGDTLLLVDMTAPSHVRSLTLLPSFEISHDF